MIERRAFMSVYFRVYSIGKVLWYTETMFDLAVTTGKLQSDRARFPMALSLPVTASCDV